MSEGSRGPTAGRSELEADARRSSLRPSAGPERARSVYERPTIVPDPLGRRAEGRSPAAAKRPPPQPACTCTAVTTERVNILQPVRGPDDSHPRSSIERRAPEVAVVPWPLLLRRAGRRADGRQPPLPVDRARHGPLRAVLGRLHDHDPVGVHPRHRRGPGHRHQHDHLGHHRSAAGLRGGRTGLRQARRPLRPQARVPACSWRRLRLRRPRRGRRGARARSSPSACSARRRRRHRAGVDGHHQPVFPPEHRVPGHGLLVDGRRRRARLGVVAGGPSSRRSGGAGSSSPRCPSRSPACCSRCWSCRRRERRRAGRASTSPAPSCSAVGTTSLLFAINRGPLPGWTNPVVVAGFAAGAVWPSPLSCRVERRVDQPLLRLAYLRRRNFAFAIATQFFTNFAYMGGFIIPPMFLEGVRLPERTSAAC